MWGPPRMLGPPPGQRRGQVTAAGDSSHSYCIAFLYPPAQHPQHTQQGLYWTNPALWVSPPPAVRGQ